MRQNHVRLFQFILFAPLIHCTICYPPCPLHLVYTQQVRNIFVGLVWGGYLFIFIRAETQGALKTQYTSVSYSSISG